MVDLADLIYVHSEYYVQRSGRAGAPSPPSSDTPACDEDAPDRSVQLTHQVLFGEREGRIALANRRKDPMFLFSSLHRQLGYPEVPRPAAAAVQEALLPQLARRLEQIETRVKLIEEEQRGGLDLTKFYERPPTPESD
jgi:hypothetical protein